MIEHEATARMRKNSDDSSENPIESTYLYKNVNNFFFEMEFSEVLQKMTEYAQQLTLMHMIKNLTAIGGNHPSLNFSNLLKAMAKYARIERDKESVQMNPNWEIISDLLISAAQKLDALQGEIDQPSHQFGIEAEVIFTSYYRQSTLLNTVCVWNKGLERERCHFSQILRAFSGYAQSEAEQSPSSREIWEVVSSIIATAAAYAERQGEELP